MPGAGSAPALRLLPGDVLGGHDPSMRPLRRLDPWLSEAVRSALDAIGRDEKLQGWGGADAERTEAEAEESRWLAAAAPLIEQFLVQGDDETRRGWRRAETRLPVPTPSDRRAFLRSLHSPFLPDYSWWTEQSVKKTSRKVCVYVDVSGSMDSELSLAAGLLLGLGDLVLAPIWAWSDTVEPARFEGRRLVTKTTGGTDIDCAVEHFLAQPARRAVILTDGFVSPPSPLLMNRLEAAGKSWGAIVTAEGRTDTFEQLGIPNLKLPKTTN